MSAPVNTSAEAVGRKAAILESMATVSFGEGSAGRDILNTAAALLRALLRERDEARAEHGAEAAAASWHRLGEKEARAALSTARADALREAVVQLNAIPVSIQGEEHHPDMSAARVALQLVEAMREESKRRILSLIPAQEAQHDR